MEREREAKQNYRNYPQQSLTLVGQKWAEWPRSLELARLSVVVWSAERQPGLAREDLQWVDERDRRMVCKSGSYSLS